MKRFLLPILALLTIPLAVGCDKPTEEQCRKAVVNIRKLTGTSQSDFGADPQAAIRSCRGNASKQSVICMMEAKTVAELKNCEGDKGAKFFEEEEEAEQKRREEWKKKQKEEDESGDSESGEKKDGE
jgi:hypothetical protein